MDTIGNTLRHAREQKGVSLADVARTTKVKYEILERIEADDTASLVSPTYTRGFIKLYAEYLGLDGKAFADAYITSQGGLQRRGLHVETVASMRRPWELKLPLRRVVILVGGLTAIVLIVALVVRFLDRPDTAPAPSAELDRTLLPTAEIDAFYQPRTTPRPVTLEVTD